MPAPYPHHYQVSLSLDGGGGAVLEAPPRAAIVGGAPPQFDGRPEWWSPEHLLLASTALCLMTTFQALAGRARLPEVRYSSTVEGTLDKTATGLAFTSIRLSVDLEAPPEKAEEARKLLESAKRHCIVSNSLKPAVEVSVRVTTLAA
jgi:organic hydroperoxide reductase OsmC/OhrA